jgi:hypothetical protein
MKSHLENKEVEREKLSTTDLIPSRDFTRGGEAWIFVLCCVPACNSRIPGGGVGAFF